MISEEVPNEQRKLLNTALRLLKDAEERRIIMRIMGAIGIFLHCKEHSNIYNAMNRKLTDIDYAAYGDKKKEIIRLMEENGFTLNKGWAALYPDRYIFESGEIHVDVFFNKISMCHDIDFKNRLEIDYPTIPLAELFLEKLQIHDINEKDLKDVALLILVHNIGDSDKETINIKHISKILSSDWGFYYTVTENLKFLKDTYITKFEFLSNEDRKKIIEKIGSILAYIESEEKPIQWRLRAKIGTRLRWYKIVEEIRH